MAIRYAVDGCDDDQGALRDVLSRIAEKDGRVVSVTWQPHRGLQIPGYTIVSEHEHPDA